MMSHSKAEGMLLRSPRLFEVKPGSWVDDSLESPAPKGGASGLSQTLDPKGFSRRSR